MLHYRKSPALLYICSLSAFVYVCAYVGRFRIRLCMYICSLIAVVSCHLIALDRT